MKRFLFILFGFLAWWMVPMETFGQSSSSPITYSCWFDEDYTTLQTGVLTGNQFLLDVDAIIPGFHSLNVQFGTDSNAQLQRFLFFRIATIPDTTHATTYSCWFDEDYSTLQSGNIGNGMLLLDVADISSGFHSLNIQLGTDSTAQLQRFLFFKVSTLPDMPHVTTYSYWIDEDYSTLQSGNIGNGMLLLDVADISSGFHSLNIQLGTGAQAQITRYMFFKTETAPTEPTGPIVYTCWFDNDYEHRQTGTLVDGMFMLDVSTLSDSNHTLFVQMGEGENAQLISHIFWMQGVHEIQYSDNIPHGTISISSTTDTIMGGHFVFDNASVTITATPGAYSILQYLVVGGDTVQSPHTMTVTADVPVEAAFLCLLPDLQVVQVEVPDTITVTQPFSVHWTLQNMGVGEFSNILVTDHVLYNGTVVYSKSEAVSLSSGDTDEREAVFTLPCTSDTSGVLSVVTDVQNLVMESEENNNTVFSQTFIIEQVRLDTVTGLIPAQDSVIAHGDILLRWNPVEGAIGYNVYVWPVEQPMPTAPSYTTTYPNKHIANYENNQFYNWKVEAVNQCNTGFGAVQRYAIFKQPIMTVAINNIAFGEVEYNATGFQQLRITGRDLLDSIRLSLHGTDSSIFALAKRAVSRYGGTVDVSFTPTIMKRSFDAFVVVQSGSLHDTVWLNGLLANYYTFTVSVPDSILPPATPVPITGTLTDASHVPQANIPVDIWVTVMGRTTLITDTTDSQGHFGCTYTPVMSECGYYEVGACLHGGDNRNALATFNVPGVSITDSRIVWLVSQYDTVRGSIGVKNRCGVSLNNVSLSSDSLPAGMSIQFDTLTLLPFQTDSIRFTLVGNTRTMSNQYEEVWFDVNGTDGLMTRTMAYYYCKKPIADLQISFDSLVCSVVPGMQKVVDVALYNNTDSIFRDVRITLPGGQTFIQSIDQDSVYALDPHDSLFVPLLLMFPEGTPLAPVSGTMLVSAENTQSQQIPFTVNVVSDATGSLTVLVSNEYTYYNNGPHVSGATITVIGYYSLDTVASGVTGSTGMITFDSLPEGYYKLYVSAPENDAYAKVIRITAGENNFQSIDLEFQAITYSWVVYQEDMDDNWNIKLNTEFKTNVPKPVLTLDVSTINVPPDGSFGEFNLVLTNHGLIDAFDVTIEMPTSQVFEFVSLYDAIDTIHALSSITIPCMVRDKETYEEIEQIKARGDYIIDTLYSIIGNEVTDILYSDSVIYIPVSSYSSDITGLEQWVYDTVQVSVPHYHVNTIYDTIISAIYYYDTVLNDTLLFIEMQPQNYSKNHLTSKSSGKYLIIRRKCEDVILKIKCKGRWLCDAKGNWVYAEYTVNDRLAMYLNGKNVRLRPCSTELISDIKAEVGKKGKQTVHPWPPDDEFDPIKIELPPNPYELL